VNFVKYSKRVKTLSTKKTHLLSPAPKYIFFSNLISHKYTENEILCEEISCETNSVEKSVKARLFQLFLHAICGFLSGNGSVLASQDMKDPLLVFTFLERLSSEEKSRDLWKPVFDF
jgi:hypothetical protein